MKEAYDIQYGLYDHNMETLSHPFQTSLYTEKKSLKKGNLFKEVCSIYVRYRIHEYFQISLLEFLAIPADKHDELVDLATQFIKEEARIREEEEEKAKREMTDAGLSGVS